MSKFAGLDLQVMRDELRAWTGAVPAARATAAMVRLLDLALLSDSLDIHDRKRAALLAIVVEQIVRDKLSQQGSALGTIVGAYRLLLQFAETRSPCPEIADWIRIERHRRSLSPINPC